MKTINAWVRPWHYVYEMYVGSNGPDQTSFSNNKYRTITSVWYEKFVTKERGNSVKKYLEVTRFLSDYLRFWDPEFLYEANEHRN